LYYGARTTAKGGALDRDHAKNMSQARQVMEWLGQDCPRLADLTVEAIHSRLVFMREQGYSPWSLHHFLTKLRLIVDQAISLGEIAINPARQVSLRRDLNVRIKPARIFGCLC
jgi:site-specific recombinase XerC